MSSLTPNSAESFVGEKKRLRIAVFNRTFSTTGGGAERYSIALVEQLASRHDIHVFAQEIAHNWPGVAYHRVSMPMRKPRWVNQLWFATCTWWSTRSGFDVVHSHENTWHGDVQTVHVLPVKYTLFRELWGWRKVFRWIKVVASPRLLAYLALEHLRFKFRPNRKIVVTSESLWKIVDATYPDCEGMISVVTPGISPPLLPLTQLRKKRARSLLGLPEDKYCVLFVANDYRKKGLKTLLAALSKCPTGFILAVVGNLTEMPAFNEQVKVLNLASRVFFLGSLKNVAPAYESADCLAHPTLEDTFAMVVLEAMSYGLPVVVSSAEYCGVAGLLQDGENALILDDPLDPFKLQRALEQLQNQPLLSEKLSKGATAFASCYQWSRLALKQEELYMDVYEATNAVKNQQ
ncbi:MULTISPECIES: glycosyltransferase family 4 protein [unclassified Polaromonas]|uniref:glycosyltransferase family 4 protein n=1 Tax=unclassified Polaromonas TaxID=2638319 RepID=UPI0018C9377A|nr:MULTISPECIES: glycosyltransferase family 4 protein [unclassified Polaromonas]MBG6072120.1 UDP-glucose:(heptosyl)LPS alpha-1,3-glucosyltransferase [Polaromonas sp. CG_9.7]MBG6114123.1 UDP-glucose:(heptosyl)LPS alpha-1,3-glucosyltransferase [Polaromonas sp. CG_9.2]